MSRDWEKVLSCICKKMLIPFPQHDFKIIMSLLNTGRSRALNTPVVKKYIVVGICSTITGMGTLFFFFA